MRSVEFSPPSLAILHSPRQTPHSKNCPWNPNGMACGTGARARSVHECASRISRKDCSASGSSTTESRHARVRRKLGPGDFAPVEGLLAALGFDESIPVFHRAVPYAERVKHRGPVKPVVVVLLPHLELRGAVSNERARQPVRQGTLCGQTGLGNLPVKAFEAAAIVGHGRIFECEEYSAQDWTSHRRSRFVPPDSGLPRENPQRIFRRAHIYKKKRRRSVDWLTRTLFVPTWSPLCFPNELPSLNRSTQSRRESPCRRASPATRPSWTGRPST